MKTFIPIVALLFAASAVNASWVLTGEIGEAWITNSRVPQGSDDVIVESLNATQSGYCVAEHNRERAAFGLPALAGDSRLETASQRHNEVMEAQNCFSHQCPGEPSPWDRMVQAGYRWSSAAENIAKGYADCNAAVGGWMNSEGHRRNILGNFRHVGCHKLGPYYTCDFGNPA